MRFLKKKTKIDPNIYSTCAGSRKKKRYAPFYDGKSLTLVEDGEIDIQEQYNERARTCDMNFIISRLKQGDYSALNGKKPFYADFHNLPTNFREVLDIGLNAERIFNDLPLTVRQQFDHDYRRFVSTAGSREWNSIMYPDSGNSMPSVPDQSVTPDNLNKEK